MTIRELFDAKLTFTNCVKIECKLNKAKELVGNEAWQQDFIEKIGINLEEIAKRIKLVRASKKKIPGGQRAFVLGYWFTIAKIMIPLMPSATYFLSTATKSRQKMPLSNAEGPACRGRQTGRLRLCCGCISRRQR